MTKTIFSKNWLIYKIMDYEIISSFQKYARGKLLDIGCGEKPYKEIVAPYVDEHTGLDHEDTLHNKSNIDLFGAAYNILPVDDEKFDTIFCSALQELRASGKVKLMEFSKKVAMRFIPFLYSGICTKNPVISTGLLNMVLNISLRRMDLKQWN